MEEAGQGQPGRGQEGQEGSEKIHPEGEELVLGGVSQPGQWRGRLGGLPLHPPPEDPRQSRQSVTRGEPHLSTRERSAIN